jgi:hypothetical protein
VNNLERIQVKRMVGFNEEPVYVHRVSRSGGAIFWLIISLVILILILVTIVMLSIK